MHDYYKKNMLRLRKRTSGFMLLIKSELEEISGKKYEDILKEIIHIYETEMLEYFPYIGGDAASGTKNLTEAYMLVAMGEALKQYGASMEQIGYLMVCVYEKNLRKIPKFARGIMRRVFTNKKLLTKMFLKRDKKNRENSAANPGSFVTETQLIPETGYDFSYHNLVCPLADFANRRGYGDYMPYICNLDYVMFGMLGVPLFREHTCFEDKDYCDFKLKASAEPMEYWPPVFKQDNQYK